MNSTVEKIILAEKAFKEERKRNKDIKRERAQMSSVFLV